MLLYTTDMFFFRYMPTLTNFYFPMKVFRFALLLGVLASTPLFAQKDNISIGPMAGANFSRLHGSIGQASYRTGANVGLFMNYSIRERAGLTVNALYSGLGMVQGTTGTRLDYLHVPVLATYYFGKGLGQGAIRPKLFIGPHINVLLGGKVEGNTFDVKTGYKPIDFGLTLGGGLNIGMKRGQWINLDVRYGLGLTDIAKDADTNLRNGTFSVNVGYSFPLGSYSKDTGRLRTR